MDDNRPKIDFLNGRYNEFKEGKLSVWIPAQAVPEFIRKITTDRGDLAFNIARAKEGSKNSHYTYVSAKKPAIPAFSAPASLEAQLAPETAVETENQIPF